MARKKPRPISDGPLKAYAHREPTPSDPRWAWRVVYYQGDDQITVKGASGRYTPAEVKNLLRQRLAAGDWMREEEEEKPQQALTLGVVLTAWLKDCERRMGRGRLRPRTHNTYECDRKRASGLDSLEVKQLTLPALQEWVDGLEDAGHSPRTVRQTWGCLVAAWRWARSRRYVPAEDLPEPELPLVTGYVQTHVTPSLEEALRVRDTLSGWQRAAMSVLLGTGARIGELINMRWQFWDRQQGQLLLSGKTGDRWFPLGEDATAELEAWWEAAGQPQEGPVWSCIRTDASLSRAMRRASTALGVPAFSPHGLRRLASTRLIAAGADPKSYAALMGHSYQMGLNIYAQTVGERLQATAAALDVRAGTVVNMEAERLKRAMS